MNFALIGCGQYGKNYIKAIQENGDKLVYVHNRNKIDETIKLPEEAFYTSQVSDILVHSPVDAVIIATPPDSHYDLTKQVLLAGKSVIVEKPFVFSFEQANELYTLAKEKELKLLVNYTRCFSSYFEQLARIVSENYNKKICIHFENGNWGPFRNYDSLWDYGSHEIAAALFFIDVNNTNIVKSVETLGAARNYIVSLSCKNISINCTFGNGFVSKRRGVIVTVDGAPYLLLEDPNDNPLVNLIKFYKNSSTEHLFYQLFGPTTYILEKLSKS